MGQNSVLNWAKIGLAACFIAGIVAVGRGSLAQDVGARPSGTSATPSTTPSPSPSTTPSTGSGRVGRLSAMFEVRQGPTTQPRGEAKFDASLFEYTPDPARRVRWATPTVAQTMMYGRPAAIVPPTEGELSPADKVTELPEARQLVDADLRWFTFEDAGGEWVTALLATPRGKEGPFPLVVATHGILSHKMQVIGQVGPALLGKGFAVLAVDLPMHGERPGMPLEILDNKNPARMAGVWRRAIVDIRSAVDIAQGTKLIDSGKGVVAVGYSLGSWMSTLLGAADPRIKAMVLMVGGATELSAEMLALPEVASSDPRVAIAAFSPRPVLMLNARNDRTVTPVMAERLFRAAREPKEQRWYDMGHLLKDPAFTDAADWITRVTGSSAASPSTQP